MFRWQTITGIALGLLIAAIILAAADGYHQRLSQTGPILSECDGHLKELVIQYDPNASNMVASVYREFLGALGPDITVQALCPTTNAFGELKALVGGLRCKLNPVIVNHPITTWSRDRWIALGPQSGGPTTLISPRGEAEQEIWPARTGDQRVGEDLAAAGRPSVRARRSDFYFDGGDFMADSENVFVVNRVLPRNLQHTVRTRRELLNALASTLNRRVIFLEEAPDHHAGMFMAAIGNHTVLVGDPRLGKELVPAQATLESGGTNTLGLPDGADFTPGTQHLFDAVASQIAAEGYKVVRIPVVPARDGRTYLTFCNVLIDQQNGRRLVYLPSYQCAESLNAAARKVWESLGYEVHPIDCTKTYQHFGCLHCLVNVLKRE